MYLGCCFKTELNISQDLSKLNIKLLIPLGLKVSMVSETLWLAPWVRWASASCRTEIFSRRWITQTQLQVFGEEGRDALAFHPSSSLVLLRGRKRERRPLCQDTGVWWGEVAHVCPWAYQHWSDKMALSLLGKPVEEPNARSTPREIWNGVSQPCPLPLFGDWGLQLLKQQSRSLAGQSWKEKRQLSCGLPNQTVITLNTGDTVVPGPYKDQIAKWPEQGPWGKLLVSKEEDPRLALLDDLQAHHVCSPGLPVHAPGTSKEQQCHSWGAPPSSLMVGVPVPMEVPVPKRGIVAITERADIFPHGYYFQQETQVALWQHNQGLVVYSTFTGILFLGTKGQSPKAHHTLCSQAQVPRWCSAHRWCSGAHVWHTHVMHTYSHTIRLLHLVGKTSNAGILQGFQWRNRTIIWLTHLKSRDIHSFLFFF